MILRNLPLRSARATLAGLALGLLLAIAQGCDSGKGKTKGNMDSASGSDILDNVPEDGSASHNKPVNKPSNKPTAADAHAPSHTTPDSSQVIAQLDRDYVIGPTAAGILNYRVVWQYNGHSKTTLKGVALRGDSAYLLDDQNYLTRINIADGKEFWHAQVAEPVFEIISVNVMGDRIYLTTGSEMLVLDAVNGTQTARWRFEKIAGTPPVEFGDMLIYGARNGELVWMARQIGYMWRTYKINGSIRVPPVLRGNVVAAVGTDGKHGTVMVLDAANATKFWDKSLLEPIVSKPVIGEDALFVAGMDQYIWAFELRTGRTLWHVLTEAPLNSSPSVIGDRLYQQIPGYGLSCYEAMPIDTPGGKFVWKNTSVAGSVIFERRGELWAWDQQSKHLLMLERERGLTKRDLNLSQADFLMLGGNKGEELFAANKDGRLVRLAPRN